MTKRTFVLGFGACALGAMIGASDARADFDMGGAPAICAPSNSTDNQVVTYTNGAASNTSTTRNVDVVCGSVRLGTNAPSQIILAYADASSGGEIDCLARIVSWNGTQLWSASQSSSPSGTDSQGSFLFQPPTTLTGYVTVTCTIPKVQSGHVSTVRGMSLN